MSNGQNGIRFPHVKHIAVLREESTAGHCAAGFKRTTCSRGCYELPFRQTAVFYPFSFHQVEIDVNYSKSRKASKMSC